jgi:hypothetical protein
MWKIINYYTKDEDYYGCQKILKETQSYFEEKSPSFKEANGKWINNDDIFNKTVEETLKKLIIIIMISPKKFLNNTNR